MYKNFVTFYNPEILDYSEETIDVWEGCISNDDQIALVERPKQIKLRFINSRGVHSDMICDGLIARVFQHEIDHLDGKLMEDIATKFQPISELLDDSSYEKFYLENRKHILDK